MKDYRSLSEKEQREIDKKILEKIFPENDLFTPSSWEWQEPYFTLNKVHIGHYCSDCLKINFLCTCQIKFKYSETELDQFLINKKNIYKSNRMDVIEKGIYLNKENRQKYIILAFGKAHILHQWVPCAIYQKLDKDKNDTICVLPIQEFENSFEEAIHFCRCEHLDLNPSECLNFDQKTFKCKYDV